MSKVDDNKKQKESTLLETAFHLFTGKGFAKTTISDIVQQAGLAKGTFYLYFNMFIPLELNLPLLVGGAVNWYVTTRSKDEAVNAERGEKGTLLASGFIAGGALMGVVSAAMRFGGINLINEEWLSNPLSEVLSMAAYILLIIWLVKASMHIKKK